MFGIGMPELIVILVVALIIIGPKNCPIWQNLSAKVLRSSAMPPMM